MFCRTFVFKHSHKKRILLSLGVLIMNSFNFLVFRIKCLGFQFHTVVSTCDLILSVLIHHPYIAAIYKQSLRSLYFKLMQQFPFQFLSLMDVNMDTKSHLQRLQWPNPFLYDASLLLAFIFLFLTFLMENTDSSPTYTFKCVQLCQK